MNLILVTGVARRAGAIGSTVTEQLLKQRKAARTMVRNEDERAWALRDMGAEVVVGEGIRQAHPMQQLDKGGHFAALEQTKPFVTKLHAGFKSLRQAQ